MIVEAFGDDAAAPVNIDGTRESVSRTSFCPKHYLLES